MKLKSYKDRAIAYAQKMITGEVIIGDDAVNAAKRFLKDLERNDLTFDTKQADIAVTIMEGLFVHKKGEELDGTPLFGKPLKLADWQIFCIYNLLGFWIKGTKERRYKEAFIMTGRKNGKTSFIAGFSFVMGIIQRKSGSTIYVVAAALKQALESFGFLTNTINYRKLNDDFIIKDNSFEHSIKHTFVDKNGKQDGAMEIQIMASNPDAQDSFNCNFAIADEVAAYKKPSQYTRFKEAQSAYSNRLMIGITTAGDNINSFGYDRMEYACKVASGVVTDDQLFSFVCRADKNEKGEVDFTNPIQHQKANPSYGITIRPKDILDASLQAQNEPRQRKEFLSRRLNIYTAAMNAWFDIEEFRNSDSNFSWTLEELASLPIRWYGGADLSRMYDLAATAIYGHYEDIDIDIVITHAFFPVTQAANKADKDQIPLYGWLDDGWLTMTNGEVTNMADIANWFKSMRDDLGFDIVAIGHDRKFAGEEFFPTMRGLGFYVEDQPQYYYLKSQGFRHIERMVKEKKFYYLHSEAYEYCVSNVSAIEKTDDAVQYQKIQPEHRIDLFDASVFACIKMLNQAEKDKQTENWWN